MLIVQNKMLLHAIVQSWTLLAALRAAHELLVIIIIQYCYMHIKLCVPAVIKNTMKYPFLTIDDSVFK